MGGIFAFACRSQRDGSAIFEGLRRLTYRGYDSVGVAFLDGKIEVKKAMGSADRNPGLFSFTSRVAVGHTRYATRGWPTLENAHPILDCTGSVAVVMDGVIDNYEQLRSSLISRGHKLVTTTDTEVISHLLEEGKGPRDLLATLRGTFSAAYVRSGDERVWFMQDGQPLVIGKGQGCLYLASDLPSLYGFADEAVIVPEGSYGYISASGEFSIFSAEGSPLQQLTSKRVKYEPGSLDRAGYPHYMLKEIYEIPEALERTTHSLMDKYLRLSGMILYGARRTFIIGNGTSLHAGMVSAYYFSSLGGMSIEVVSAAEFPYYALDNVGTGTVVLAVSQSGETSDVIRSIKMAKQRGAVIVGVTNVLGSRLALESNVYLPIGAGPELAVPATKTFTSTLAALMLLAAHVGLTAGKLSQAELNELYDDIRSFSKSLAESLPTVDAAASKIAGELRDSRDAYVVSSGITYPVALEGALKLKEAAMLHAEGVQLGELRHGPMVLTRDNYPIIVIKPREEAAEELYSRVMSELRAREAKVIEVSDSPQASLQATRATRPELYPIAAVVPLQLLAYRVGFERGLPIDLPPGLAKAITT